MDEKMISFDPPIMVGKQEYAHITLKEPTVGALRRANQKPNPMDVAAVLIAQVAGVPESVVDQMSQHDFEEAMNFLSSFSSASQENSD